MKPNLSIVDKFNKHKNEIIKNLLEINRMKKEWISLEVKKKKKEKFL